MLKLNAYGETYNVYLYPCRYLEPQNLCINIELEDGEPWSTMTVNLGGFLKDGYAFVDTNNNPGIEEFIRKNKLGFFTGECQSSGFCIYPLYKFNMAVIEKYMR